MLATNGVLTLQLGGQQPKTSSASHPLHRSLSCARRLCRLEIGSDVAINTSMGEPKNLVPYDQRIPDTQHWMRAEYALRGQTRTRLPASGPSSTREVQEIPGLGLGLETKAHTRQRLGRSIQWNEIPF